MAKQLEIGLFIVSLQSLKTLFGSPLDALLLFFLNIGMGLHHDATELLHARFVLMSAISDLVGVLSDGSDEIHMLLLFLRLGCVTLLLLKFLRYPRLS